MPFYTLKAGCRGNESQDWAQMLLVMYQRWAVRNGYNLCSKPLYGARAGIIETLFLIDCEHEWLESEIGVHRLVRVSPFDPEGRRHSSFAELLLDDGSVPPDTSFGAQIRSYVFAPYQIVKDTRTKLEIADPYKVLDGYIEPFIEAYQRLKKPAA